MRAGLIVVALLGLFVIHAGVSMDQMSTTYDEPLHLLYGERLLGGSSLRIGNDDSKMPISVLNALPGAILSRFRPEKLDGNVEYGEREWLGRWVTILAAAFFGWIVFLWARDLYGSSAGVFALFLYVFSPNILAHAGLVTTDIYAAGLVTSTLYLFWRFLKRGRWTDGVLFASSLGIAQVAKYSCLLLVPICLSILALRFSAALVRGARPGPPLLGFARWSLVTGSIVLCVIHTAYLYDHSFGRISETTFWNGSFRAAQARAGFLGRLPILPPLPYVQGIDRTRERDQTGRDITGKVYLKGVLGSLADPTFEGFRSYYFYASAYKIPLATSISFFTALVLFLRRRRGFLEDEIFILLPLASYLGFLSFFLRAQIGFRHFLMSIPLAAIFASGILKDRRWRDLPRAMQGLIAVLATYLVVSVLSYHPHHLAYFNELIGDRKTAYRVLADSNIDWGQTDRFVLAYKARHPDALENPETPRAGRIIVSVNALTGVAWAPPERFRWLREHFEPVDHIGYAYLVYEISEADLTAAGVSSR